MSSEPLTPEQLSAIRSRLTAALGHEWKCVEYPRIGWSIAYDVTGSNGHATRDGKPPKITKKKRVRMTRHFVLHDPKARKFVECAPGDIEALLAEVERLRGATGKDG